MRDDNPNSMQIRRFTLKDLSRYDGQDNRPAFIAHHGKVYDVSGSFLWQSGKHQAVHTAGADLTDELAQAPHGPEIIEKFPFVGVLCLDEE